MDSEGDGKSQIKHIWNEFCSWFGLTRLAKGRAETPGEDEKLVDLELVRADKTEEMDSKSKNSTEQNSEEDEKSPTITIEVPTKKRASRRRLSNQYETEDMDSKVKSLRSSATADMESKARNSTKQNSEKDGTSHTTTVEVEKTCSGFEDEKEETAAPKRRRTSRSEMASKPKRRRMGRSGRGQHIPSDSEEHEEPHKDVIIKTFGGKGKIKPN